MDLHRNGLDRAADPEPSVAQLIVGMTPALAAALDGGLRTEAISRLHQIVEQAHVVLRPESTTSTRSPAGSSETAWYWADLGDGTMTDAVSEALMHVPGITAAYLKPDEELP